MDSSSLDRSKPGQSLCPPPNGVKLLLVLTLAPDFCSKKRQVNESENMYFCSQHKVPIEWGLTKTFYINNTAKIVRYFPKVYN